MNTLITHYTLTFGSSAIILVLFFLLSGIRIPEEENLKKLLTGRKYLSLSYFILAIAGFLSYFAQTEAENDPVLISSTLFIASYQALLFTATSLIFIQAASVRKKLVITQICVITIIGIPLILSSVYSPDNLFPYILYTSIALYLFQLGFYTYLFRREYGKSLAQLENYYDEEENDRLKWVKFCFYSALGIGILALLSLFLTFIYGIFVVIYTVYYAYMVSRFYNYVTDMGFLIPVLSGKTNPVEEKVIAEPSDLTEKEKMNLLEKEQQLKFSLEKWVEDKLYCQKDAGVDDIVEMLGTNRDFLRYYFRVHMPSDFRTWRAELRIAEAKKILKENTEISLEEVWRMTGFNHRANFHRQFQKITGQTPTEYKNKSKNQD